MTKPTEDHYELVMVSKDYGDSVHSTADHPDALEPEIAFLQRWRLVNYHFEHLEIRKISVEVLNEI
jgi:hypothetical protein